jgi:hypothetical protein
MRTRIYVLLFCAFFACFSCQKKTSAQAGRFDPIQEVVPLVRILALPGNYDKKHVRIAGVLSTSHESTALFLDENSLKFHQTENSVWLNFQKLTAEKIATIRKLEGSRVRFFGFFDSKSNGHFGLSCGSLEVENAIPLSSSIQRDTDDKR